MRFQHVVLGGPPKHMDDLGDFYEALGFKLEPDRVLFQAGETTMEFDPSPGEPFYHFAFLVPGDRFSAAFDWARKHAELLPDEEGHVVFDFDNWDAQACYFEDPAGNIVELAAHAGIDENGRSGDFSADEIVGLSELGLVGDREAMAGELEKLDFRLWEGTLTDPDRLAFVGERGRTLILAPPGRGWFPTGRVAENHPVEAVFAEGSAIFENGALVINVTSA
jgi:D-alanyl-D-alanine carboxypeptidase